MDILNFVVDSALMPYVQIIFAMMLGILIGLERKHAGKMAGMRTYALVTAGSCFLILIPLLLGIGGDPLRYVQGILTGIGFLGAGIIMHHESQLVGLTTAAGVWVSTAIGIAVGVGLLAEALFVTILVLFIFTVLGKLESKYVINQQNL